ncbi:MAG TPA: MXAN_6640 family putative metalloprotease [Nocardioides sp.]|nr:MXAN_6640 family putative metalloprotease [Nocardioides sp.]
MTPRRNSRVASLVAVLAALLAALLIVPLGPAPARADDISAPADPPALDPPLDPQETAEQALDTVEEIIDGGPVDPQPSEAAGSAGKDLTLALRDLAVSRADLPRAKRATAARLLARPTDAQTTCSDPLTGDLVCYPAAKAKDYCNSMVCIHWVDRSYSLRQGVPSENDGSGGRYPGTNPAIPDYVEYTLATVTRVAQRYAAAGYRPVAADGAKGGDSRPDVYLGQLGDVGVYGYCAPDDYTITAHDPAPGYCVLDNDYAEFGIAPSAALQVTAAHEYFHAVQFAYDINEDAWLMEATATWAEDQLYDRINDNRAYLPYGPAARPYQSLDLYSELSQYGTWIFVRFLGERYQAAQAGMPTIVRDIWRKVAHDDGEGAAGMYSVEALRSVLAARDTSLATQLAWFTVWNRRPATFYEEGAAYPASPTRGTFTLRPAQRSATARVRLDHLAASTYRFEKKSTLRGAWRLSLVINLPDRVIAPRAVLTVKRKGLAPRAQLVSLNAFGNRALDLAFGPGVQWIDVTAVNGSARYSHCGDPDRDATATCQGFPIDEDRLQTITARAHR